jgi:aminoglycoside phosphotransferase (APT) family kinase protein
MPYAGTSGLVRGLMTNSNGLSVAAQALKRQMLADGTLASPDASMTSLNGGVSSDVYLVVDLNRRFVVKQALAHLKVKESWQADIARNISERDYLGYVGKRLPNAVPALIEAKDGYFVMEYLGDGFVNWKDLLLAGRCDPSHATLAGNTLGTIHGMSSNDKEAEVLFNTTRLFHQLRTDPYLLTTGRRHPEFEKLFQDEAERLDATRECLVHGDYSPKNMLIKGNRLVVLDCETAWYGDPAFDIAFLLCHLLLKGLYHGPKQVGACECAAAAVDAYFKAFGMNAERQAEVEERTAKLTLMLLLARVDGKSPVEYLTASSRQFIRRFATRQLGSLPLKLGAVSDSWFTGLLERSHAGESK